MKAIGYTSAGEASVLKLVEIPNPKVEPSDLLVEVKAVAINPVDIKIRKYVSPSDGQPKILGWDAAGVVKEVGSAVKNFKVGDEVYYAGSKERPGANSQLHAIDEALVGKKPRKLSFAQAASIPLTTITAWEMIFDRIKITSESTGKILVIGGAGGVGSMALQLLKLKTKLKVFATAARPQSAEWAKSMGADVILDHSKGIAAESKKAGVDGYEYILGLTHTDKHFADILEVIKPEGYFSLIDDANVDLNKLKTKSITINWEMMFTRSSYNTPTKWEQGKVLNEVSKLIDEGIIRHTMTDNLGPLSAESLQKAHEKSASATTIGKIVLEGFAN